MKERFEPLPRTDKKPGDPTTLRVITEEPNIWQRIQHEIRKEAKMRARRGQ